MSQTERKGRAIRKSLGINTQVTCTVQGSGDSVPSREEAAVQAWEWVHLEFFRPLQWLQGADTTVLGAMQATWRS